MKRLGSEEIGALSLELPLWTLEGDWALVRKFVFPDFKTAFAFMINIAAQADHMDHHPEWSNVYNRVDIRLTTHDAKGITKKDIELAKFIDASASRHAKPT